MEPSLSRGAPSLETSMERAKKRARWHNISWLFIYIGLGIAILPFVFYVIRTWIVSVLSFLVACEWYIIYPVIGIIIMMCGFTMQLYHFWYREGSSNTNG